MIPSLTGSSARRRLSQRLMMVFCVLTLVVAAASSLLHFSAGWIAIPVVGALASALLTPVTSLVEMFWGGRR